MMTGTYEWARDTFKTAKDKHAGKPLDRRNTRLRALGDDVYAVKYHATDIAIFHPSGNVEIRINGWWTNTTAERLSEFSPIRVWRRRGEWFFNWRGTSWVFYDGMLLPGDRRKRPTTLDYRQPERVPTLREHEATLAEIDHTAKQVRKLAPLIVKYGLASAMRGELGRQMLQSLEQAELVYQQRVAEAAARKARAEAPIIRCVGKELRPIALDKGGGNDDDSLAGGGHPGPPATSGSAG